MEKCPLQIYSEIFDISTAFGIDLMQVEIDYVICALHVMNFIGTGYPENINLAVSRVYDQVNANFKDGLFAYLKNDAAKAGMIANSSNHKEKSPSVIQAR